MSAENEAVVRRFYEEMNNGRKNELAAELFTADHQMHDPQVPTADGPDGMVAVVSTYQTGVNGHWEINDIFSVGRQGGRALDRHRRTRRRAQRDPGDR